jgi:hypothetical protein
VILGKTNENEIIIRAGLKENDMVYLVPPESADDYRLVPLDTAIVNHFRRLDEKEEVKQEKPEELTPEEVMEMTKDMTPEERMKFFQENPALIEKMGKSPGQGRRQGGGKSGR